MGESNSHHRCGQISLRDKDTSLLSRNCPIQLIEHHRNITLFNVLFTGQKAQSFSVPLATGTPGCAWAAVEAMLRLLAAELGPHGVRTVCLHSAGSEGAADKT